MKCGFWSHTLIGQPACNPDERLPPVFGHIGVSSSETPGLWAAAKNPVLNSRTSDQRIIAVEAELARSFLMEARSSM